MDVQDFFFLKELLFYSIIDLFLNLFLITWKIEDVVSKFKSMHFELVINPSSASYEKLICYCCGLFKV